MKTEWISVNDRLPELGEITDVWINLGVRVTDHKWDSLDVHYPYTPHSITHWMPLPESPKKETFK